MTSRAALTRTPLAAVALLLALLVALLSLAGCSTQPSSQSGADSAAGVRSDSERASTADQAQGVVADAADPGSADQTVQASVISTGEVSLSSRDVGAALTAVRQVVSGYGGGVQKESTDTDDRGAASSSYLTVRVPSADFTAAMVDLGRVATLVSTSSRSKDVTTVVLDNDVRVQIARKSIDRISTLLGQATSIRDVISIEGELADRQADLASLESQQKYLADQTSMATITVSIDRASPGPGPAAEAHSGFVAGLGAGWHALGRTASAVATIAGALLPWAVVVILLGVPVRFAVRRRRHRATA